MFADKAALEDGYPTISSTRTSSKIYFHVYVGGAFTDKFAVIDKATKALVTGYPAFIECYDEPDDNYIYLGGAFTGKFFGVIDKSSKALVTGYPTFDNNVNAIGQDNNYIYLGGTFTGKFAVIDKSSKAIVSGYPAIDDSVRAILPNQ